MSASQVRRLRPELHHLLGAQQIRGWREAMQRASMRRRASTGLTGALDLFDDVDVLDEIEGGWRR